MREAVIVSTARTPIGRAYKGAFNNTHGATLGGHVIRQAILRAGLDGAQVEDVVLGCGRPEGATGGNIARQAALDAGLPTSVPGLTVSRMCSSGLQAIAIAAQRVISGEGDVFVAGGLELISLAQNAHTNEWRRKSQRLEEARAHDLHADVGHCADRRDALRRYARGSRRLRLVELSFGPRRRKPTVASTTKSRRFRQSRSRPRPTRRTRATKRSR